MTQSWSNRGLIWCNPPFSLLSEVVNKIHKEGAQVLLVLPEWPTKVWWRLTTQLMAKSCFFPSWSLLFENDKGPMAPTRWAVRVAYIASAPPCNCSEDLGTILRECPKLHLMGAQETIPQEPQGESPSMGSAKIQVSRMEDRHLGELQLKIILDLRCQGMEDIKGCKALIDTGAEVCLVRKDVIPPHLYQEAKRPVRLWAANKKLMDGGNQEVLLTLVVKGTQVGVEKSVELRLPTWFYAADIKDDLILSYEWCRLRGIDISARHHGLLCITSGEEYWVDGLRGNQVPPKVLVRVVQGLPTSRQPESPESPTHEAPTILVTPPEEDQVLRALDLFSGTGSVTKVLRELGYQVTTLDLDPKYNADLQVDICNWDFTKYPEGYFHLIAASPPCTEFSRAKTVGKRDIESAVCTVARTLEVVRYFKPKKWWLETPRYGLLPKLPIVEGLAYIDVDYCQFVECGFQKPTRIFGGLNVCGLPSIRCNPKTCASVIGGRKHKRPLGGPHGSASKKLTYPLPDALVKYLEGGRVCPNPQGKKAKAQAASQRRASIQTIANPEEGEARGSFEELAWKVEGPHKKGRFSACEARDAETHPLAMQAREEVLKEFANTSLSGIYPKDPPVRGPFGAAEIWLKPNAIPVVQHPYRIGGERGRAWTELVDQALSQNKLEPSTGAWNLPTFPVAKKTPGKYRLVQDFRPLNDATVKDGHPLPRIVDILHSQGKNKMWSKLDLVDGFHQMPLRAEHRPLTCMSTPRGTMQWNVLVLGMKNASAQFQRMMEWVLKGHPYAHPYIDDIIVGSDGTTTEEVIRNHTAHLRAVLKTLEEHRLVCSPQKSAFFQKEIEFLGHVIREGVHKPAPGKLLPIQKWELPQTVTELRGFLGLTNYFSEYIRDYAEVASPLMAKLKLGREEGKKGSKKRVEWQESDIASFNELKKRLAQELALYQPDFEQPFILRCDASDHAIGAVLSQIIDGKERPVGFYSRKLTSSQLNWAPKEKEMYAVVAALLKWSGVINFQPVLITTDHRALEHWVTEHVETPSGPRGRRARWHQILSQFDLEIRYIPGPDNVVADAMSRWAYPASSAREDVSAHGSKEACEEVERMMRKELLESQNMALVQVTRITSQSPWKAKRDQEVAPIHGEDPPERPRFRFKSQTEAEATPKEQAEAKPKAIPKAKPKAMADTRPVPPMSEDAPSVPRFRFAHEREGYRPKPQASPSPRVGILQQNWDKHYRRSPEFSELWEGFSDPANVWPIGWHKLEGKMYHDGLLCVPASLAKNVLTEHHEASGHCGVQMLLMEAKRRYEFENTVNVEKMIEQIRKDCFTCQTSEVPNLDMTAPLHMNPIIEGFMSSVALDVFDMPPSTWLGNTYDCVLLCVDRASGWIVARPTTKIGLTGERAAHLLLDTSWGEMAIPSLITSDQGPQFVSQWWRTMCSRLGIRQAYSQARRPQANGRAETAGKTLRSILRKLNADTPINWVEALPRAIRIRHDLPTPLLGLSPYQMVFGRERPTGGLPTSIEVRCPTADVFMDHMNMLDKHIAKVLNDELRKQEMRLNKHRPRTLEFEPNEWVWILRPTALTGPRLQSWWLGPFKVVERNGDQSYTVQLNRRARVMVHVDQMKRCTITEAPEVIEELSYTPGDVAEQLEIPQVQKILDHRKGAEGLEMLVQWKGTPISEATWTKLESLTEVPSWIVNYWERDKAQE